MVVQCAVNANNETKIDIGNVKNEVNIIKLPSDLALRLEILICNSILIYEEYAKEQSCTLVNRIDSAGADKDAANIENIYSVDINNDDDEMLTSNFTSLFEKFMNIYNKLLKTIQNAKKNNYQQFMFTFRKTNPNVIKLYEFAAKLLNNNETSADSETQREQNNSVVIKRTLELLHILITSKL
jgi:hypothetical protein